MAEFILVYLAALARGLAAHGLSLPLEAVLIALLPSLPPHACGLIALLLAVIAVETVWLLVETWRNGAGGKPE